MRQSSDWVDLTRLSRSARRLKTPTGPTQRRFTQRRGKITLKGVRPPIWRRLIVPDNVTLARLHLMIQATMGWENAHMHEFDIGGLRYGEPSLDSYIAVKDEKSSGWLRLRQRRK
ncbi:MAG: plasmid pRiA4b ORF-3 family protein [Anaerolineales bacterium]|nr:plasmid pRiA4b ORF-3 family protein [Anaerolineales bacterium]